MTPSSAIWGLLRPFMPFAFLRDEDRRARLVFVPFERDSEASRREREMEEKRRWAAFVPVPLSAVTFLTPLALAALVATLMTGDPKEKRAARRRLGLSEDDPSLKRDRDAKQEAAEDNALGIGFATILVAAPVTLFRAGWAFLSVLAAEMVLRTSTGMRRGMHAGMRAMHAAADTAATLAVLAHVAHPKPSPAARIAPPVDAL